MWTHTTKNGVILQPSDKSEEEADARFAKSGGLRVSPIPSNGPIGDGVELTSMSHPIAPKRKAGRPKSDSSYPGPSCGMSRAKWYRERKKKPHD